MTLCEIATADHYSPPLECVAFDVEAGGPRDGVAPRQCVSYVTHFLLKERINSGCYSEPFLGAHNTGQATRAISGMSVSNKALRTRVAYAC